MSAVRIGTLKFLQVWRNP